MSDIYRGKGYERDDGWEYWPEQGLIVRRWRDDRGRRCTNFLAQLLDTPCADFTSREAIGRAIVDGLASGAEPWDRDNTHKPSEGPFIVPEAPGSRPPTEREIAWGKKLAADARREPTEVPR